MLIPLFPRTFNCISVVPIASRIVKDLSGESQSSKSASVLLVTIWELGEAAGPLFLAPLSETFGRWPVINVANGCFVAATALAALCQTTPLFIAARALSGLVVTANVLNPAVMGDIWEAENRGSPMSLMTLGPFIGGTAGPAISGLISEQLSWRWVLWMSVLLSGTCAVLLFTSLPETYGPVILRRRNKRLHISPENGVPEPPVGGEKGSYAELAESIARPGIVFVSSGVLMALSLWSSVAFAHYYNMATTLPGILEDLYGLSPALTGSAMLFFSKFMYSELSFTTPS
jgi:MFS family permease